jgi:hypothetical protein
MTANDMETMAIQFGRIKKSIESWTESDGKSQSLDTLQRTIQSFCIVASSNSNFDADDFHHFIMDIACGIRDEQGKLVPPTKQTKGE